ncbi:hypothetical protein Tco_1263824 [Tanacetum coccineum]
MGLWYPKDSGFELIAYSDADHAGCKDDCKKHFRDDAIFIWKAREVGVQRNNIVLRLYYSRSLNMFHCLHCCSQVIWMRTHYLSMDFEYHRSSEFIIMAQQQHAADVHPDELCPPNKRYDLMDANKKVELEHFWHTLKEDGSKHRLKFLLDRKELTLTLDDFRTIFHLPQANDNNHASFVPPPSFSDMVPFYKQVLGFTMELKTVSNFKISGLLQPWQTLCKIFSKCLTTRVTGWDQPPLQIMQMLYCFVNNIHVDYAELMWEGIYYSLHHPATSIPYPRFTKIIISHYMTIFPDISRRARDAYHNLQDDDIMKNIFNSGRNKNKVGMRIPAWMITDEMKLTEHYKMYAEVFGLDVPLTQSQPTESTQGTHRTLSAPRSPNPATETAESSVPKRSTVIRFRLPSRQSARLTPPVPVPSAEKADEMILQDMIQVSLLARVGKNKSRENVAIVKSDKESPEVEIVQEKEEETTKDTEVEPDKDIPMVDVTNIVIPVNVDDEEDEITDEVFELRRRAKGKNVEETRISPNPSPTRSPRNLSTLVSSDTEKLQELTVTHPTPSSGSSAPKLTKTNRLLSLIKAKPNRFKRYKSFFHELPGSDQVPVYLAEGLILERKTTKEETERLISKAILQERGGMHAQISSQIQNAIDNDIPSLVDDLYAGYVGLYSSCSSGTKFNHPLLPEQNNIQIVLAKRLISVTQQQDIAIWLALQMNFERLIDGFEYEAICIWRVMSGLANVEEQIPTKQVSQDIMEEISLTIDEAKLKKMADEMLRQRCTSGDEHQYHNSQMKNSGQVILFRKALKENSFLSTLRKDTP